MERSIVDLALGLPRSDRVSLALELLRSLDAEYDSDKEESIADAWDKEIAHRLESLDNGDAELLDGEAVLEELRNRLSRGDRK